MLLTQHCQASPGTMNARLTVQDAATRAHDFQMAPTQALSGCPLTRKRQLHWRWQLPGKTGGELSAGAPASTEGRTLVQPALPHGGHQLFPQRRIRHGFFQGEAPGPGTSGGCPSIPAAGTLLRRPGARRGHPAGRPGLPPLLRPGLPGAARAWAREAPRPRRGEAVPPYLRLCGSG